MGGTAEVRNVKIYVHFLTCYLLVLAITANLVLIPFVSCDGLILAFVIRMLFCVLVYRAKWNYSK